MSKYALAIIIVAFWLFLPIPLMIMGVSGYNNLDLSELEKAESPDILYNIAYFTNIIKFYFQTLFFTVPGINFYIGRFINFIQILSGLLIFLLLRGD